MKSKRTKEVKNSTTCSICGSNDKVKEFRNDVYCAKCLMVQFHRFEDASYPKCEECGSIYLDPAIKKGSRARINRKIRPDGYMCSWCSIKIGDTSFISKRAGDNLTDKKTIVEVLRLVKEDEPIYDTEENFEVLSKFEWYEDYKEGKDLGSKWRDYYIWYTGVVVNERKDLNEEGEIQNPGWYVWHPDDRRKLVWVFRARAFYKNSLAFVEILQTGPLNVKESIQNAQKIQTKDELEKVWKALQLFRKLKKNSGRPATFNNVEHFKDRIRAAYKQHYYRKAQNESSPNPTHLEIAASIGVSQATLYSTCNRLELDLDQYLKEIKAEIEAE